MGFKIFMGIFKVSRFLMRSESPLRHARFAHIYDFLSAPGPFGISAGPDVAKLPEIRYGRPLAGSLTNLACPSAATCWGCLRAGSSPGCR